MNVLDYRSLVLVNKISLINVFYFVNYYEIFDFFFLDLTMKISNLDSEVHFFYARTTLLLDMIAGQKSSVLNYYKSIKGKDTYKVIYVSRVTLRKQNLLNFFYFLLFLSSKNIYKKYYTMSNLCYENGNFSLVLKDISVFPGFLEYFFKWEYPLLIKFLFSRSGFLINEFYFKNLGLVFFKI